MLDLQLGLDGHPLGDVVDERAEPFSIVMGPYPYLDGNRAAVTVQRRQFNSLTDQI